MSDPTVSSSVAGTGQRLQDQLFTLQTEYKTATNPQDIASLGREIKRADSAFDTFKQLSDTLFSKDTFSLHDGLLTTIKPDGTKTSVMTINESERRGCSITDIECWLKKYGGPAIAIIIGVILLGGALYIYGTKS